MPHFGEVIPTVVVLAEHAESENSFKGTAMAGAGTFSDIVGNGIVAVSTTITTTKRCAIVITAALYLTTGLKKTDIQRAAVNLTSETTISAADGNLYRMHLQYATEILDAGVYTYDLVNTSGGTIDVFGAVIKAVAVSGD